MARSRRRGTGWGGWSASPERTAEFWPRQLQPSLRDLDVRASPGVETPGYFQSSLRDRIETRPPWSQGVGTLTSEIPSRFSALSLARRD